MIREWPKNSLSIETSLVFGLPETLGIINQENVWVHIHLKNNLYVPINAEYCYSYPLSKLDIKLPTIFYEDTKQIVEVNTTKESSIAYFGIIYECKHESFLNGSFCITFTGWKDEILTYYYTAKKEFSLEYY